MNKERAIENIKKLKEVVEQYNKMIVPPQKECSVYIGEDTLYLNDEMLESLDKVIECLEQRYQMNDKGEITPLDNEWVDVRDRLPIKEEKYYLVDTDFGVEIMRWHENTLEKTSNGNGGFENVWEFESDDFKKQYLKEDKINAWRPLPQPYERKEAENEHSNNEYNKCTMERFKN